MRRGATNAFIAGIVLLGACGADDDDGTSGETTETTATDSSPDDSAGRPSNPPDGTGDGQDDGVGAELRSDVERAEPSADAPVDEVVAGSNDSGFDLQRELSAPGENLVFSPASLSLAFGMAAAGAGDEATSSQLSDVFGFPGSLGDETTHEAMNLLLRDLELDNADAEPDNESELTIANSGWAQQDIDIGEAFLDALARHYDAGLFTVDFAGDGSGSREEINAWVAEATNDRIENLLGQDPDPNTVYMLINAIYLKASWALPFAEQRTEPAEFTRADGSAVEVPMMHNDLTARHEVTDDYTAVRLPYADGELVMNIVMPNDLAGFVDGMDAQRWAGIIVGFEDGAIQLTLPKWETDSELQLADPLSALGLEVPGGDYSGVAPGVFVSDVLQAANITVNEEGTEAAAATAVMMAVSAPAEPAALTFDRPFFYTIEHEPTGLILFAGQVHDPS